MMINDLGYNLIHRVAGKIRIFGKVKVKTRNYEYFEVSCFPFRPI